MRKINKKNVAARWFDLPEDPQVKLLIRPFALRNYNRVPIDTNKVSGESLWEQFDWSLMDWKGMVGEDGKKEKCNEKNKNFVFNYDTQIMNFVLEKANELKKDVVSEESSKNSLTSQPGDTQKKEN